MNGYQKLDTTYQVETPENVDLTGKAAGPVIRICAYLIDLGIRFLLIAGIGILSLIFGNFGIGIFLITTFLLEWFYPIVFELFNKGQTPGKKIFGIAVVNENQTPVGFSASFIRNLLRAADFLPMFYLLGLISMTSNTRFKRLGDLAASTVVIYKDSQANNLNLPNVSSQIPPTDLSLEDQIAVINFTQRHEQLSLQRKIELAEILTPLTQKNGEPGVSFIQGMGCWLLGDKK